MVVLKIKVSKRHICYSFGSPVGWVPGSLALFLSFVGLPFVFNNQFDVSRHSSCSLGELILLIIINSIPPLTCMAYINQL